MSLGLDVCLDELIDGPITSSRKRKRSNSFSERHYNDVNDFEDYEEIEFDEVTKLFFLCLFDV